MDGCFVPLMLRDGCVVSLMDSVLGCIVALILRGGCIVATLWRADAKSWLWSDCIVALMLRDGCIVAVLWH